MQRPDGMTEPAINGKVLNPLPALSPATIPPERTVKNIHPQRTAENRTKGR